MKKLSLLFVFAAMLAFVSCGPSAEKKAEEVKTGEEVIENTENDMDAPQQETVQQEAGDKTQAVQEEIETTRTVGDKKTSASESTINAAKKRGNKATEGTIDRKDKE
ncbi:MAG: hypothetical protein PHE03_02235 [Bacteroidales bacterium]|nr:hypothetical protein [Bacteroidales bacterium]MDD3891098.1 hypothetical protein [Bacteroidales bacterium]